MSYATFVMLNPSTADADVDDPTIRRCMGFARAWGMGGLGVVNLYGYRATDPRELHKVPDPVGPHNDLALEHAISYALDNQLPLIAAWGSNAEARRVEQVMALCGSEGWECLGTTIKGAPRHPLYLPATAERRAWRQP